MITKRDLIERMKQREAIKEQKISPEIQKQVEEMGKRWERVGVKFDSQATDPEIQRQASRVLSFATLLKDRNKK